MSHRIVSLIASGTEIVSALGLSGQLVGRSHECDFPAGVQQLPVCCEPRIDVQGSSREIDLQVRQSLREAVSIYRVLTDELNRLQPTHIVTQSQCDVCAVSLEDVQRSLCEMIGSQPEIISLNPMNLSDFWNDLLRVARLFDVEQQGRELMASFKERLNAIRSRLPEDCLRPSVLCLEWLDPMMSAGNWVPELVEIAGGDPVLCSAGKHSPYFQWQELLGADPEIIVVMPCGFDMHRTLVEMPVLEARPEWKQLQAVRNHQVYVTDGHQYFNRPGPRLVESAEILEEIFAAARNGTTNPPFRHEGTGWVRTTSTG